MLLYITLQLYKNFSTGICSYAQVTMYLQVTICLAAGVTRIKLICVDGSQHEQSVGQCCRACNIITNMEYDEIKNDFKMISGSHIDLASFEKESHT